jgi:putative ABC transport system ATP-binding protein
LSYLSIEKLVKEYGSGEAAVRALRGIDLQIRVGEWVAIMGRSGSGKSTLLSVMGALNAPTTGRYLVDGIDVYGLGHEQRADFRREYLGFVFQSFHLIPYLTAEENAMLPLATAAKRARLKRSMARDALERVGLEGKGRRLPGEISGGEQERVAIARAIVNDPPILLADEPTGNLDTRTTGEIMGLLDGLNRSGMTILMVTHSPECARYAHRILQLSDGLLAGEERLGEPGNALVPPAWVAGDRFRPPAERGRAEGSVGTAGGGFPNSDSAFFRDRATTSSSPREVSR